jgi:hypothetical protein
MQSAEIRRDKLIKDFNDLEAYCMFIGHPRSGHSLFGAFLDAHPEIVMAHEFNALKFVQTGFRRDELFLGLLRRARGFARRGRKWNGYKYKVPNQWHGRYRTLKVIGDKKGGASTTILKRDANVLENLRNVIGLPVKICHVIRNPFDNIRTISRYYHHKRLTPSIEGYFSRCDTIQQIKQEVKPTDWLDIYHEDVVVNPPRQVAAACQFLGVTAAPDYLKDCASIVFKDPLRRRFEVAWTPDQRNLVESNIRQYGWLSRYSYES